MGSIFGGISPGSQRRSLRHLHLLKKALEYIALIKLWVFGDLEMPEAAQQFDAIRHRRAVASRPEQPVDAQEKTEMNSEMTQAELLRQISDLSADPHFGSEKQPTTYEQRIDHGLTSRDVERRGTLPDTAARGSPSLCSDRLPPP